VIAAIATWYLVYRGVRLSTTAGVVLGSFELLVFLALAITLIAAAGGHNTLAVFGIDFAHLGIGGLTYPANVAPLICLPGWFSGSSCSATS
jgi:hypothetical protein